MLATSGRQSFASLRAGKPIALPPPSRDWEREVVSFDPAAIEGLQSISMVGATETINTGMRAFVERMRPDELMIVSHIYDHAARVKSLEIVAEAAQGAVVT